MGRVSLSFFQKVSLCLLLSSGAEAARKIADVKVPEKLLCGDKELPLQAAGLRTATIFNIKVYVVALYAEKKLSGLEDPALKNRPVCYDITYLRDVSDEDVDKAWEFTFKESSDLPYPGLKDDVKRLQQAYGEIKGERRHLFALLAGKTELFENGKKTGEIPGEDFQKNFFTVWYGKNPPTSDVKDELLKGF